MITLDQCRALDQQDELAKFKAEFDIAEGTIYLDGNSLGAMPKAALAKSEDVILKEWREGLITSWNNAGWWSLPETLGDKLGPIIGADKGETVITDTTSLNLYKVLSAAVHIQQKKHPHKKVIIAERDNFPTDLYMIEGLMQHIQNGYQLVLIDGYDDLASKLNDDVAVVLLAHVNYRTGYFYDMATVNQEIHAQNALVIWDLCHSVGAVPMELKKTDSDFAIGCTYKYLNGGPGSPALLWCNPKHLGESWQPLSGWWGHDDPFEMEVSYRPAKGVRKFLCGTQPILSMSLIDCGLDIFLKADINKLRTKSLALTDLFIELVDQECAGLGLTLITPLDHKYRGSHVSYAHKEGYGGIRALVERGVIGDYREPEVLRFGVTPLYLSFEDIWNAVQHIKAVFENKEWDNPKYKVRGQVT